MASLIVTTGQQEGHFYPLGRRTNVIGRDEALTVQILDKMISRKHMQIRYDQGTAKYLALDMKSSNGVYVNNQKITGEVQLSDGDVISIGITKLLFTDKDFDSQDSALRHYKKVGERMQVTAYSPQLPRQNQPSSEKQA
ncbi:MAG: FHA domain-containing protein [Phycisphaerae bacterium]|nr:FHA domain-containing protein [Phycisphaerae bacterium]